jgi:hypothetical protein
MDRRAMQKTVGVALVAWCLLAAQASADAGTGGEIHLTLPHLVAGQGSAPSSRTLHGAITLRLPAGWHRSPGGDRQLAHLTAPISSSCTAEVEVQVGASRITKPIRAEVDRYVNFWFHTEVPAPVELVASFVRETRRWVLAVPHSPPSPVPAQPGTVSPFFGVFVKRLAPHVWASIGLGARVPSACTGSAAPDQALRHGLILVLRSARVTAHVG